MAAIILVFFNILACIQARTLILVSTAMFWMLRSPMVLFLSVKSGLSISLGLFCRKNGKETLKRHHFLMSWFRILSPRLLFPDKEDI